MRKISTLFSFLFTRTFYHKAFAYWLLILFIYSFRDLSVIFFLTFIFAYLFYSSACFLKSKIYIFIEKFCKKKKKQELLKKVFSTNIILIIEYILFISFLILIIANAIPKIQWELTGLSDKIPILKDYFENIKSTLSQINSNYKEIDTTLQTAFTEKNYELVLQVLSKLKSAWNIILQFVLSIILSFVFLLDRKKIKKYLWAIKNSSFSFLYFEYKIIFEKIIKSFWLILKAQSLISLVNTILTSIGLFIIWTVFIDNYVGFPYLLTLSLLVFIFGFIPVLGVFLSSIPIIIVGYSFTYSIPLVIAIIFLIFIIHMIEAYILNPNIVSNFLELPISLTFLILIIWEHLFGVAGLLIWVSLFYFVVELLKDIDKAIKKKHKIKKIEKKILKRVNKS